MHFHHYSRKKSPPNKNITTISLQPQQTSIIRQIKNNRSILNKQKKSETSEG